MDNNMNNQFTEEETVINLLEILQVLWKWAWLIVVAALLSGSVSYMVTKLCVTPMYKTEFTAYVNNRNASIDSESYISSSSDVSAARSLANSYAKILVSREILLKAVEEAGYDEYTYEKLSGAVTATLQNDTEIISVSVELESPQAAFDVASALAGIAGDYIGNIVEGSSMKIIDSPVLPETFCTPSYLKNTAIGEILGAVLVCVIIIVIYFLDDTIKSEKDLEERFALTIIGTIPDLTSAGKKGHGYGYGYGYARKKQ
ncbi:MAG: Wzz/FepE/Etk N-terminal domain-containing protein [Lachnospiraceae bacterium]|nr:Wzz/FepE/Etk N-terminal domain-containing protein [Lachnospiraceae bacterium]